MQIQLLSVKLPKLVEKKEKEKCANKTEANDKGEERKCPKCNIISFILLKCVLYATAKEDIKPMVLLKVPKK